MTFLGLLVSMAGGLLALRIIVGKLMGHSETVPGWTSLVTLMLLLSGIQLVSLGLVGQYVSRVYEEAKRRPLYYITERIGR